MRNEDGDNVLARIDLLKVRYKYIRFLG
jgi:hypothetical protein